MRRLLALLFVGLLLLVPLLRARQARDARIGLARQWPVMGTFLNVTAIAPDSGQARAALAAAGRAVFRVDSLMSTWKPESEISRLNAAAGTAAWTALSAETLEVLLASLRLAELSGGAFDVTVGPLMQAWGFRGGEQRKPRPAQLDSARALVGTAGLEVDSAASQARLRVAGSAVDLGAIAKGYALDLAAAALRSEGASAGLVDLGGNVVVFGRPQGERAEWVIGILDPRDPTATIGEISLRAGAVASSGDYEQFFEAGGVRYSHIMDPARGEPARGTLQTTVLAPTGMLADGLSTTLFVLGPERGRQILDHPSARGAAAVWVRDSLPLGPEDVVAAGASLERIRIRVPAGR